MQLAYTDPGTGSMVVQVAIAGAAGLAVAARAGWARTAQRLRRRRDREALPDAPPKAGPRG